MQPERDIAGRAAVTVCTHAAALDEVVPEWRALWSRCPDATPFQSPDWLVAWWRTFGARRPSALPHAEARSPRTETFHSPAKSQEPAPNLWTLLVRTEEGHLVGVAPLYVSVNEGLRVVRLIGAGVSDRLEVLAEPGWSRFVCERITAELGGHPERWDVAEFQQLPEDSLLLRTGDPSCAETVPGESCPVAVLTGAESAAPSQRLLSNLQQDERRIARRYGQLWIDAVGPDGFAPFMSELRHLHAARWMDRGETGVLGDEDVWEFHVNAAREHLESGIARLYALRLGDRIAGAYYGFCDRGRAYYYLGGFDPEYRQFGIGNLLVAHAMNEARAEGAESFDFLRGREAYKYRWGARDVPMYSRRLYREAFLRRGAPESIERPLLRLASAARSVA